MREDAERPKTEAAMGKARYADIHTACQVLNVSTEASVGLRHEHHPDGVSARSLSQGCVLGAASGSGGGRWEALARTGGWGGWSLQFPSLAGSQPGVTYSGWPFSHHCN